MSRKKEKKVKKNAKKMVFLTKITQINTRICQKRGFLDITTVIFG